MWTDKEIVLSSNALAVLARRYLIKDNDGRVIETPRELFIRVAKFIAEADRNYGANDTEVKKTASGFFEMMASLDFLPNSPTLMNAGRSLGQLSACFVLPVGDSIDEIFEANKQAAIIHKSGGGTGFSFSRIRPRNSIVATTSGVASGPVSFMKVINASTEAIKQGGTRRGANMGILRVDHPDIMDFITSKSDTAEITNFNISVAITDAFMQALAEGKDYALINPKTNSPYIRDGKEQTLKALEVFEAIVSNAWLTGEPGIVFIDRMNRSNPTFPTETIEATNPCGEQPLPPYDSCNLGSINLGHFIKDSLPNDYSISNAQDGIDWPRLATVVRHAVHFLDNVIDQNKYPIPAIEFQTRKNRRIGLGVMGWADMLVKLRLPYDSPQALGLGEQLMSFILSEGRNHSSELATIRGKFPNWEGSIYKSEEVAMRNATVTTIAPTGTISIIANCSSGIEPYYSLAFERNVMDGTRLTEINSLFERIARMENFYSDELIGKISSRRSITDLQEIPSAVKAIFVTAADVSPENHIKMQAVFQKFSDSSVSKTINLPESATKENVRRAYELAYELGCKGVTIYRDNSRPNQVLSTKKEMADESVQPIPESRPEILSGFTEKIRTGYGNLYVTVNNKNGRPFEVFAHIGKSGYTTMADTEAICRLISLGLRSGIPVTEIIRQLRGIGGSQQIYSSGAKIFSIPDAIAQILNKHFITQEHIAAGYSQKLPGEICPDCGSAMLVDGGCQSCQHCGYSNC
ncbi:MAG: vitamin B12-dependent ribonucleotide reductase [candidate division Zixibacteria bacterium]|nr:vitamin B12-dependent ribonucleotide reductase [candidate division Zixibacteria bacterium]